MRAQYLFRFSFFWGQLYIKEKTQMFTFLWVLRNRYTCEIQMPVETQHVTITLGSPLMSLPCPFPSEATTAQIPPHYELVLPVLENHINGIFMCSCVRLLTLSIKVLRFICNVGSINSLFPSIAEQHFIVGISILLWTLGLFPIIGYSKCFSYYNCTLLILLLT